MKKKKEKCVYNKREEFEDINRLRRGMGMPALTRKEYERGRQDYGPYGSKKKVRWQDDGK